MYTEVNFTRVQRVTIRPINTISQLQDSVIVFFVEFPRRKDI